MKRLLLHVCCGPCSLMPVRVLREEGFEVTGYFANPNIHPVTEYLRRREAMREAAERLNLPMLWQDDAYNLPGWLGVVHELGLADNAEGGRCRYCYESRLGLTAATAAEHGFDAFSTSLLYSRHQRHEDIRSTGEAVAADPVAYGAVAADGPNGETRDGNVPSPAFVYRDFRPYWQEGINLSKEWGLYRQNYCACIFSEAERFAGKLAKLGALA